MEKFARNLLWLTALCLCLVFFAGPASAAWGPNQDGKITPDDFSNDAGFGHAVAISGQTAVVGCLQDTTATTAGQAYIFEKVAGVWTKIAKLLADDGAIGDQFGQAVAIDGDTIIVGARHSGDNGTESGSAYVFERDAGGADNWGKVAKILPGDGSDFDRFGLTVAVSGDTVLVGAPFDDGRGSAYIFEKGAGWTDGSGNQAAKIQSNDIAINDQFGYSVSLSGETALVGAVSCTDGGERSGAAYVFKKGMAWNDGAANQAEKLVPGDGENWDWFGFCVSLSENGLTAIIGSPYDDDNGASSGSAYVFTKAPGDVEFWIQTKKLLPGDPAANDEFGTSVAISGDTAICGAWRDEDNGSFSGSAYVFIQDEGGAGNWGQAAKLLPDDGVAHDHFGKSVAISGDLAMAGPPETTTRAGNPARCMFSAGRPLRPHRPGRRGLRRRHRQRRPAGHAHGHGVEPWRRRIQSQRRLRRRRQCLVERPAAFHAGLTRDIV